MFCAYLGNQTRGTAGYRCSTCGDPRPPYRLFCERHLEAGERRHELRRTDQILGRLRGSVHRRPDTV